MAPEIFSAMLAAVSATAGAGAASAEHAYGVLQASTSVASLLSRAISGDLGRSRAISGDLGRSRCSQALSSARRFSILTMCLDKSDERAVAAAFDAVVAHAEAGDVGVGPAEVRALRSKFCSS